MFGIGAGELLVIGVVGVLLFGGRLPELALQAGRWIRRIQRTLQDVKEDIEKQVDIHSTGDKK